MQSFVGFVREERVFAHRPSERCVVQQVGLEHQQVAIGLELRTIVLFSIHTYVSRHIPADSGDGKRVVFVYHGFPFLQRSGHIDQTLVAAASEAEAFVAKFLLEPAVHKYVDVLQQLMLPRIAQQPLKGVARVAPDALVAFLFDGACHFGKSFRLVHRVAAAEGHVGKVVGKHLLHDLVRGHPMTVVDVPRFGIVTAGTPVRATCRINGGPESRTVHCGIFYDVKY